MKKTALERAKSAAEMAVVDMLADLDLIEQFNAHAPGKIAEAAISSYLKEMGTEAYAWVRDTGTFITNREYSQLTEASKQRYSPLFLAPSEDIEKLKAERDAWRKDFGTLAKAIVGETGLSAIDEAKRLKSAEPHLASFVGYGLFDEMGKMLAWTDEKGFAQAKWSPSRVRPIYACRPAESSTALQSDLSVSGDAVRVNPEPDPDPLVMPDWDVIGQAAEEWLIEDAPKDRGDLSMVTAFKDGVAWMRARVRLRSALVPADRTENGRDELIRELIDALEDIRDQDSHHKADMRCSCSPQEKLDEARLLAKAALTLASEAGYNDGGEK